MVASNGWYTQINLSWAYSSTNQTGFIIQRSTDGTNFIQIAQVLPSTITYRDVATWPSMTYLYRVCAYNAGGNSAFSNVAGTQTPELCSGQVGIIGWGDESGPAGVSGVVAVTAGWSHSLALQSDGTVVGWGDNSSGQATPPTGLSGVVAISAGFSHSLALESNGTVVGWGDNTYGESSPPSGLSGVETIAAGEWYSLALESNGTVVGWGYTASLPPPGLSNIVAIAAGNWHGLGLRSDGTIIGWGDNYYNESVAPAGLSNVVAISAGDYYSLALRSDGTVVVWGFDGDSETNLPAGLGGVVGIAAGGLHALALKSNGTVVGWGYNSVGQIDTPAGLSGVGTVSAGGYDSFALVVVPYPPANLTATAVSSNEVDLAWTSQGFLYGFNIQRAPDNGGSPGPWTQIATIGPETNFYADTGLTADIKYWFQVQAFDNCGSTSFGNLASATPLSAPVAPSSLSATAVSESQINLAWTNHSATASGILIERAPDASGSPGMWTQIASVASNATAYSDTGLSPLTTYWYRIRAYNIGGDSAYSNLANATTQVLTAPSSLQAAGDATNQILLFWTDNSNYATGYAIERAPDNGGSPGTFVQIATVATNSNSYADTGLPLKTTFWYRVRAFNATAYSAYSNVASGSTLPLPPLPPTNLAATTLSTAEILLSWVDINNDELGFSIERAPDNQGTPGWFAKIGTVRSNVTTYVDSGLTAGKKYWYRVRAYIDLPYYLPYYSTYSNLATATTFPNSVDSWISPASGKWESGPNWSLGAPPSDYLSATFITNGSSKTVTIDAITVSNYPGSMTLTNLNVAAPPGATNTLLLSTSGTNTPLHLSEGLYVQSGGLVDVENSLLQLDSWPANGYVNVTNSTVDGTLLVQNGGQITLSGVTQEVVQLIIGNVATGQMTVSGGTITGGQSMIDIGYAPGSQGTLTIATGATVLTSVISIGRNPGATGTVWMTGGQLIATNDPPIDDIYVGDEGTGQMTISNGTVLLRAVLVACFFGAQGTFTMAGGSVTASSGFDIGCGSSGYASTGTFWMTGGQFLANGLSAIGSVTVGRLIVTGGVMQVPLVIVGSIPGSQGSLTVSGGVVSISSNLVVGDCASTASGQVTVVGGGSLFITNSSHTAFLDVRHGTLLVSTGGVLVVDRLVMTNACGLLVRSGGSLIVGNLVLDPNLSAIGDGIPNWWKQQYGLDPLPPTAYLANADPDGDGCNNLCGVSRRHRPDQQRRQRFRITSIVRTNSSDYSITWMTGLAKTNALQATTNFPAGYSDIFTVTNTTGTATNYTDPGAVTNNLSRAYRIRLVP